MKSLYKFRHPLGGAAFGLLFAAQALAAPSQVAPGDRPAPDFGSERQERWNNYPEPPRAPAGAPNVLLIMTDDVGFGSASTFGGLIPTPTFDELARHGLRYNEFHTTAMCSPTRAALLTGRNHHAVATGSITNVAIDEPGYTSVIPDSAATVGRVLRDSGYDTAFFGKNHNTPIWETGPMGPFNHWPNGLGFDYFYGFNAAAADQFRPELIENRNAVEPPEDPSYIFDKDLTDHMINWLHVKWSQKPDDPFFIYLSPGTMHSPHQAPADWIARFKGKFDMGWDRMREEIFKRQKSMGVIPQDAVLTPRPDALPAWDSLSPEAQKTYARQMEVAAAQLSFFDNQLGRVIDELRSSGQLDNTLIIYLQGDNGASMDSRRGAVQELQSLVGIEPTEAELIEKSDENGTRDSYSNYNAAWAWAQNAPFPWGKQVASHLGGLRDGLVISWPDRIHASGQTRRQFHHVIDIAPTIYEAAGIHPPEKVDGVAQQPIDGVSMVYSFSHPDAPSTRHQQYFEMLGNRSFYKEGWLAATTPPRAPFDRSTKPLDPAKFKWELYNLTVDYSQAHDISAQYPGKLAELKADFDEAAKRNHVYPIEADLIGRVGPGKRPSLIEGRDHLTFYPGDTRYAAGNFPSLKIGWKVDAHVTVTGDGAEGPVVINGDEAGGAGLLLDDGRPLYLYNPSARAQERVELVGEPLPVGDHTITIAATADPEHGPRAALLSMLVDGKTVTSAEVPILYPARGSGVVGRYNVRTLLKGMDEPSMRNLSINYVEFTRK
ncbi:arylsulfatase [Altericroceibacterium endophyticum]|uniref:Sulfatase-like hydrolase/transferase n=1 Tax=Altericroceibacterium endophyticum TaxID=1808508 RepID=A0A6I4T980_9SPHN|nr:arylsulfatase [Altericroceibacterium endophyticum]MXO66430.1 sulfatase-like hydrolase/transferase [Altericroceibacterium endophyticum]